MTMTDPTTAQTMKTMATMTPTTTATSKRTQLSSSSIGTNRVRNKPTLLFLQQPQQSQEDSNCLCQRASARSALRCSPATCTKAASSTGLGHLAWSSPGLPLASNATLQANFKICHLTSPRNANLQNCKHWNRAITPSRAKMPFRQRCFVHPQVLSKNVHQCHSIILDLNSLSMRLREYLSLSSDLALDLPNHRASGLLHLPEHLVNTFVLSTLAQNLSGCGWRKSTTQVRNFSLPGLKRPGVCLICKFYTQKSTLWHAWLVPAPIRPHEQTAN